MTEDVSAFSATKLVAHYRNRQISPVEATLAAITRYEALNPTFNAFVRFDPDGAMLAARESEARWFRGEPLGPVDGLPVTVKDLILVRGWPTLRGSRTIDPNQPWTEDGPPPARLRESGAVFLGKTTTPEFGWKGVTDSPLTGITGNPWNPALTPGGSSGGAAVAAALGIGSLHLATDGGGSIRIPAGFCGLFGFKPTFGIVPVHPHSPALTLWHQGPISRTVEDAALMMSVIAAPDARDWYAAPFPRTNFLDGLDAGIAGARIAYSRTLGYAKVDPDVATLVDDAVRRFESLGAHVEEIDLSLTDPIEIMQPLWATALALAVEPMTAQQRAAVDPPLLALAEPGTRLSALDYRKLERAREQFGRRMNDLHAEWDFLVTPQLATTAFATGHEVPPGTHMRRWWEWSPFTYPFNLSQQPAATVPCGFAPNGLPVAMQIVARKFEDRRLMQAARAFESLQPFRMPDPRTTESTRASRAKPEPVRS
ncbi:MAG: amidase [Betaproteobacteria bacterium]|nr:amidase [Betaproteobacteria bacterium]